MYGVVITPFFMPFYKLHHLVLIYIYCHDKWYMKKGGKNMKMKKMMLVMLVVMLIGACCACSSESKGEVPQQVLDENPMFVYMGKSIEIAGETYSASQFRAGHHSTQGDGYFLVNRINRQVYYIFDTNGGSRSGLGYSVNTGLIYEGPINGLPEVSAS